MFNTALDLSYSSISLLMFTRKQKSKQIINRFYVKDDKIGMLQSQLFLKQ